MTAHGILAITRHAESEWNQLGKWTGLTDVDLTDKGKLDAEEVGTLLKDMTFDVVLTSEQRRTHQTLQGILKGSEHADVDHTVNGAINERDYGELTGKNKWEVQEEIGEAAFTGIRRGWDYPVPGGETLKDVFDRVVPYFDAEVLPLLKEGRNVLMVAHGNSLRALMKHLEDISEEEIATVEMAFGHVHLYHIDEQGSVVDKETRSVFTGPTNA